MKVLLIFALFGISLAELNSYDEFTKYSAKNDNKSVSEYAMDLGFKTFDHEFSKFKFEHKRQYNSVEEEERRKFNFLKTLEFIEKHNKLYKTGQSSHEVGITLFADMTSEEYVQTFSMPKPMNMTSTQNVNYEPDTSIYAGLPASFDWRQQNKMTPVKNQGGCGSCWAFATVATIESGYAIKHNQWLSLSEQQLVDCMNTGCAGRYINQALDYVQANGVEQASAYPYQAHAYACRNNGGQFHARISGYRMLGRAAGKAPASDDEIMSNIMSNGPLALMFDAFGDDFAHYRGGVLTTGATAWKAVHAVAVVGWGSENGVNYWIIKNSWGTQWGEGGYFKMARGRDLRGVNEYLYYPLF